MNTKKHVISGTAVCSRCGSPTRNATPMICLPCLFEIEGFKLADFAIDNLFHVRPEFKASRIISFFANLPIEPERYNSNLLNLKSSIIKVCEQTRELIKTFNSEYVALNNSGEQPCEQYGEQDEETERPKDINKFRELLYQESKGICHYCEKIFTRYQLSYDCVLPVHLNHRNSSVKFRFYESMHRIGNLRVCCKRCNAIKGLFEKAGKTIMLKISSAYYRSDMAYPVFFETQNKPKRHFLAEWKGDGQNRVKFDEKVEKELDHALKLFAVRIICSCTHLCAAYFLTFDPSCRTIVIGCGECVQNRRILAIQMIYSNQHIKNHETKNGKSAETRHMDSSARHSVVEDKSGDGGSGKT